MAAALEDAILSRLESLIDEYTAALRLLNELTQGIDRLRQQAGSERQEAAPQQAYGGTTSAHIRVENTDVDRLLDFQEQLSRLPGVAGVSIAGMNSANAALVVEFSER